MLNKLELKLGYEVNIKMGRFQSHRLHYFQDEEVWEKRLSSAVYCVKYPSNFKGKLKNQHPNIYF